MHRDYPIEIPPFGRNVDARRRRVAVFNGIPDQMVQDLGEYCEFSVHLRQWIMGNDCAAFGNLLGGAEERLAQHRLHVRRGGALAIGVQSPLDFQARSRFRFERGAQAFDFGAVLARVAHLSVRAGLQVAYDCREW